LEKKGTSALRFCRLDFFKNQSKKGVPFFLAEMNLALLIPVGGTQWLVL